MIKNNNQLAAAQREVEKLQQLIEHMSERYSGLELELMAGGIEQQIQDIQEDIDEYHEITELSFEQAVNTILRRPMLIEHLGELLAKLRLAAGVTQTELAERIGWRQENVSRFESENYSSQTLYKIIEYTSGLGIWLHVFPSLKDESLTSLIVDMEETDRSVQLSAREDVTRFDELDVVVDDAAQSNWYYPDKTEEEGATLGRYSELVTAAA